MIHRRKIGLFAFLFAVVASSVFCATGQDVERLQDLANEESTRVAITVAAVETSAAGGVVVPSDTPILHTATPTTVPPTPTATATHTPVVPPDLSGLAIVSLTDPAGDAFICNTGAPVDDPAVDVQTVEVFDPAVFGSDFVGYLIRVGLGASAADTFANDYSAALLAAFQVQNSTTYTVAINEIHADVTKVGVLDLTSGGVISDTQNITTIDEAGYIFFQVPANVAALQFQMFHTPTQDTPIEEKRCDLAPDEQVYELTFP